MHSKWQPSLAALYLVSIGSTKFTNSFFTENKTKEHKYIGSLDRFHNYVEILSLN
jgi:hypothetical protein